MYDAEVADMFLWEPGENDNVVQIEKNKVQSCGGENYFQCTLKCSRGIV